MSSSRPIPSTKPLDSRFSVIQQVHVTEGTMNAGIFIVRDRATGEACIKKDFKRREIEMGSAQNEIRILRSLKHRNIVDYIHAHLEEDPYVCKGSLYMELCEYGSVDNILDKHHEHNWGIGESAIWSSFKQLANAIGYIQHGIQDTVNGGHSVPGWRKILHRDIVPRNVFIKTSGHRNPRIVLGDFGISTIVDSMYEEIGGYYEMSDVAMRPPESPGYGPASEIHALGRVILSMVKVQGYAERYGPPMAHATYFQSGENSYSQELEIVVMA